MGRPRGSVWDGVCFYVFLLLDIVLGGSAWSVLVFPMYFECFGVLDCLGIGFWNFSVYFGFVGEVKVGIGLFYVFAMLLAGLFEWESQRWDGFWGMC